MDPTAKMIVDTVLPVKRNKHPRAESSAIHKSFLDVCVPPAFTIITADVEILDALSTQIA